MLGLAEYVTMAGYLQGVGQGLEAQIADELGQDATKVRAITVGKRYATIYQQEYKAALDSGLREIARNAIEHYSDELGTEVDVDSLVDDIVSKQYTTRYYGATLNARLKVNQLRLQRRIVQSAQISPLRVADVFTKTVPFGAQVNVDKRILLGTAVKIENDVAKEMAGKSNVKLIRWTLSGRHAQEDACDDLANTVNEDVTTYLEENNLTNIDPKGLYFPNELPNPPHPNCQCEYGMVTDDGKTTSGKVKRALKKVRKLLRRLKRK